MYSSVSAKFAMPMSPRPKRSVPAPAPVFGSLPPGVSVFFLLPQAARKRANEPAAAVPPTRLRKRRREAGSRASSSIAGMGSRGGTAGKTTRPCRDSIRRAGGGTRLALDERLDGLQHLLLAERRVERRRRRVLA